MIARKASAIAVSSLIAASVAALVSFGIVGIGRQGIFNFDGRVLFAAGRAWLRRADPYDFQALSGSVTGLPDMDVSTLGFFYPPQSSAICILLGSLPYPASSMLWATINVIAIAALVAMVRMTMRSTVSRDEDRWGTGILAAMVIGNPFTNHVVWMGQTSLVAFAATMGAWVFAERKRWLIAGVCLGLASFKPQLCLLIGLWLLLEREWKTILTAAVTAVTLAVYPMLTQGGPMGALNAWRVGLTSGYGMLPNQPSFSHKIGIESLLNSMGVASLPGSLVVLSSMAATVALWLYRRHIRRSDVLALLMIFTFTFTSYLHDYDYVGLIPAFASLWRYARTNRMAAGIAAGLLIVLFLPQRLLLEFNLSILDQWRTVVIVLMGIFILCFSSSKSARAIETAAQ